MGGTQFDCFFIAIILAPSSTAEQWQSHHRSAQSFAYSVNFYIVACIIVLVASRDALVHVAFSVGALRMHLLRGIPHGKKTDRYLLHNCILRNVNGDRLGDHRFVSIETPPQFGQMLARGISQRDIESALGLREKRILGNV